MGYKSINWQNSPTKTTPLNAENLNHMEDGILTANKGIAFDRSITFDKDGVIKNSTTQTTISAGNFATNDTEIVTAYISSDVTNLYGGAFSDCTALTTVYIDNTTDNISIDSGAIPDGVSVIYCDDDNFINVNLFLANAIESIANRRVDKVNVAVDLSSQSVTDIPVVNMSGCTVENGPSTGSISGTVVNFKHQFSTVKYIVQYLILTNSTAYKRVYRSTDNSWTGWEIVSDNLSNYLKIADLQDLILNDESSSETTYSSVKIDNLLNVKEYTGNKVNTINIPSPTSYPTTQAVVNYVGAVTEDLSGLAESKNIFDFKDWIEKLQAQSLVIDGGTLDTVTADSFTFTRTGANGFTNSWTSNTQCKIFVKPNTTYTLSWEYLEEVGSLGLFLNGLGTTGNAFYVAFSAKNLTFTTKEDTEFITVRFGLKEIGQSVTVRKIQLEEGSKKTFYLPHMVAIGINEVVGYLDTLQQQINETATAVVATGGDLIV